MRLMSSPLQVTIMSTLVERLGEPPKQRYRLFDEYYRTIYNRETNREGTHSELLRERKTDIDTIHYRTGLLLQAESEIAGSTQALLSLPRFLGLVQQRLCEQGLEGSELARLIDEIRTSALDRLIFLVSPHDEEVGFEIRSLQEFMAAEAIARGNTTQIRERINEIAPITNWRNVFLFLVGKLCDEDNVELLDHIILLCAELNDPQLHPDYASVKWGSRLAIDILVDGATRPSPKRERHLLRTALEILDHPTLCDPYELASIYTSRLEDIYRPKVEGMLGNIMLPSIVSAWELLQALAKRNIEWARQKHNSLWPQLSDEMKLKINQRQLDASDEWELKIAIEVLPKCLPTRAFAMISGPDTLREVESKPHLPAWLNSMIEIDEQHYSYDSDTATMIPVVLKLDEAEYQATMHLVMLAPGKLNTNIREMPCQTELWHFYFHVLEFANNPNRNTLASALRHAPDKATLMDMSWLLSIAPWPLTSIIHWLNDDHNLSEVASSVESGELGDLDDWLQAQQNSQKRLAACDLSLAVRRFPFDRESLKSGLPLIGSFTSPSNGRSDAGEFALRAWLYCRGTSSEGWAATFVISQAYALARQHPTMAEPEKFAVPFQFVDALIRSNTFLERSIDLENVLFLFRHLDDASQLPDLLDQLALSKKSMASEKTRKNLRAIIRDAVVSARVSVRALQWANWAISNGLMIGLSGTHIEMSDATQGLTAAEKAFLRLGATDINESECENLIEGFCNGSLSSDSMECIEELARAIESFKPSTSNRLRSLALDRFSNGDVNRNQNSLYGNYSVCIYTALDERRSALRSSSHRWASLGFPDMPMH